MRSLLLLSCLSAMLSAAHAAHGAEDIPAAASIAWVDLKDDSSRGALARYELLKFAPGNRNVRRAFAFPKDANDGIYGIDVSHHNGAVNWQAAAQSGVKFVYMKATQGDRYRDARFTENWAGAAKDGKLRRGAYHFLTSDVSGKDQARTYLALLSAAGGLQEQDLAPVLDLEWDFEKTASGGQVDRWSRRTPAQIEKIVLEWVETVKAATGRTPMIYTAASWWNGRMQGVTALAAYPQWVADYRDRSIANGAPVPVKLHPYHAWQFTDAGRFQGAGGKFDVNRLNGSDLTILAGR